VLENFSDRWLVEQFLFFKNEKAFSRLYDRHCKSMYAIALQITDGNKLQAEDIIQTTWLKAIQKLNDFRWESSLRTWLISILIITGKEINRKIKSHTDIELTVENAAPLTKTIDNIDLEKAMALLPPGYKVVFVLHDIEGYKHEEIGTLLGIHAGTSKSQLFNARKMLRNYLMN